MTAPTSTPWFEIRNLASDTAEVKIYGNIGDEGGAPGGDGVTAKQFCDQFNAIQAPYIDLRINSAGGQVFDASAICTAIKEHPATVTAHVDGLAASCASWVAASCDSVQMGKSAFLMIHNPMNLAFGTAEDLRKQAGTLDKMANAIAQIYADKSGKPKDQVLAAMNEETWFDAAEAKAWGLCDAIKDDDDDEEDDDGEAEDSTSRGGSRSAINSLAPLLIEKFRNVPDRIRRMANTGPTTPRPRQRPKKETPMQPVIVRDGKHFVNIDGKEIELKLPEPTNVIVQGANLKPAGKTEEEVAAAVNAATKAAIDAERKYRETYETILNAAKLTGKAADDFKKFYGLPESQLKFLAENAIAARTLPVGEGGATDDPAKLTDAQKVEKEAGERFDATPSVRRTFGNPSNDVESDTYKTARGRYVAAARRQFQAGK